MIAIKKRLIPLYEIVATALSRKRIDSNSGKTAYIFLAADYNNIGDLAINYAQEQFIKSIDKDYKVVSVVVRDTYKYIRSIRRKLKENDLIFIQGGGNFGDLYPKLDYGRLFVAKYFSGHHQVCSFPQTIVFTDTEYGRWRLKKTRETLSRLSNVTLFAREKITYEMMQATFGDEKVRLSPDIVLSLLPSIRSESSAVTIKRTSIVLTLRADGEKKISAEQQQAIVGMIDTAYDDVVRKDTEYVGDSPRTVAEGYEKVLDVFDTYKHAKVVVTDRLHGMIFAAITGTPCVVLPNSNHKISETYNNWLQQCNYIKFVESASVDEVKRAIDYFASRDFKTNYDQVEIPFDSLDTYLRAVIER